MADQWHLLINGEKYGPYSEDDLLQFVREGRVVRESLLWTEGMDGWVAAATIDGLFPPLPTAVALPRAIPRPVAASSVAARSPQQATSAGRAATQGGQTAKQSGQTAKQSGQTAKQGGQTAKQSGQTAKQGGQTAKQNARAVPSGPYPALPIKPANFELLLVLLGSGLTLVVIAKWADWRMDQSEVAMQDNQKLMMRVMLAAAAGCLTGWLALNFIYLHRLWSALQYGRPRTTPGQAVGLLFVPLFNLYWIFIAFYGLAQDYNRITGRFKDLNRAPKLSEGLFLAYCICAVVVAPVAVILWVPMMLQVCKAITFMALPPQHRARMSRPR